MKIQSENTRLSRRQLRGLERELGVYLDIPVRSQRSSIQQLGVFDEDEKYAGDVTAQSTWFSVPELDTAIRLLFRNLGTPNPAPPSPRVSAAQAAIREYATAGLSRQPPAAGDSDPYDPDPCVVACEIVDSEENKR